MKATFIKKSKICKDGKIYEVDPPLKHNGKKYKYVRTARARKHQTGILIFPDHAQLQVLKDDMTTASKATVWHTDKFMSHEEILKQVGVTEVA